VKSVKYSDDLFATTERFDRFLSFIDEGASVAPYIAPSVEKSAGNEVIVTMSEFSEGSDPRKLPPDAPFTWIYDETAVRTQAKWFSDFRAQSIKYSTTYPEDYKDFPEWDTVQFGIQKRFTPITIPITEQSFGVIHADAHQGNYLMNPKEDGTYDMTMIDFDNAQKSWYIVDPGTVVFNANARMFLTAPVKRV